jgi:hypothetical protein
MLLQKQFTRGSFDIFKGNSSRIFWILLDIFLDTLQVSPCRVCGFLIWDFYIYRLIRFYIILVILYIGL